MNKRVYSTLRNITFSFMVAFCSLARIGTMFDNGFPARDFFFF